MTGMRLGRHDYYDWFWFKMQETASFFVLKPFGMNSFFHSYSIIVPCYYRSTD